MGEIIDLKKCREDDRGLAGSWGSADILYELPTSRMFMLVFQLFCHCLDILVKTEEWEGVQFEVIVSMLPTGSCPHRKRFFVRFNIMKQCIRCILDINRMVFELAV